METRRRNKKKKRKKTTKEEICKPIEEKLDYELKELQRSMEQILELQPLPNLEPPNFKKKNKKKRRINKKESPAAIKLVVVFMAMMVFLFLFAILTRSRDLRKR